MSELGPRIGAAPDRATATAWQEVFLMGELESREAAVCAGRIFPRSQPAEERMLIVQEQLFSFVKEHGIPVEGEVRFTEYRRNDGVTTEAVFYPDWMSRLAEEFGGNREAAEVAWALGQRPAGYQGANRA